MTPLLVRSMLLVFLASVVALWSGLPQDGALRLNKSVLSFVIRLVLGVGLFGLVDRLCLGSARRPAFGLYRLSR